MIQTPKQDLQFLSEHEPEQHLILVRLRLFRIRVEIKSRPIRYASIAYAFIVLAVHTHIFAPMQAPPLVALYTIFFSTFILVIGTFSIIGGLRSARALFTRERITDYWVY